MKHLERLVAVTISAGSIGCATLPDLQPAPPAPPFKAATGFATEVAFHGGPGAAHRQSALVGYRGEALQGGLGFTWASGAAVAGSIASYVSFGPGLRYALATSASGRAEWIASADLRVAFFRDAEGTIRQGVPWSVGTGVRAWITENLALSALIQRDSVPVVALREGRGVFERTELVQTSATQLGGVISVVAVF
jgi:hypothetical protein